MREPIREPAPEGRGPRGPEPIRYTGQNPVNEAVPSFALASLVEWAPIWGGMFVSLGVLILLSTLGVAIGVGSGATAAGIWGAISVIIGFFVGGWFTGRTMTIIDSLVASAHGLLMWAVALVFSLVFTVTTALLGISSLSSAARAAFIGNLLGPFGVSFTAPSTAAAATTAVTSSWVTFLVLLLGVIAAIVGALVGNQGRFSEVRH